MLRQGQPPRRCVFVPWRLIVFRGAAWSREENGLRTAGKMAAWDEALVALQLEESPVEPVLRHKLLVGSRLVDAPVLQYNDDIGAPDGRETVRDDESRAILHQIRQRLLNQFL
jgi:hypothetical protein